MRVLQLVSSTGFYGAERMVSTLSASLCQSGEEVYLGLFNARTPACARMVEEANQKQIPVWNLRCRGRWELKAVHRLVAFLQVHRIDVLHTHGYKANLYGVMAARLAGCAIVATCHNWTDRTAALRRYAALDRMALRWFDTVAAVSQSIASELRLTGVRRVRMIANGIDVAKYQADFSQATSEQLVLGCVSRLSQEKGVDVLLWALPKVLKVFPALHCVVAGEGPERERLMSLATELGISNSVHMPGFCDDTPEFLRYCTMVVQPSRMEAMPLAVLEAMAAGKAVVASAVGEIPRLLEDGNAGVLVPPDNPEELANAILRVLSDKELRLRLEKRAAAKAETQFDVSLMTSEYRKVYEIVSPRRQAHDEVKRADGVGMAV